MQCALFETMHPYHNLAHEFPDFSYINRRKTSSCFTAFSYSSLLILKLKNPILPSVCILCFSISDQHFQTHLITGCRTRSPADLQHLCCKVLLMLFNRLTFNTLLDAAMLCLPPTSVGGGGL